MRPFIQSSVECNDPSCVAGKAYWWVASDVPVGTSITNYMDRISSNIWKKASSNAFVPTNTTSGFRFDGYNFNVWVTNDITPLGSSFGIFMVLKLSRNHTIAGLYTTYILGQDPASSDERILLGDSTTNIMRVMKGSAVSMNATNVFDNFPTNVFKDICITVNAANSNLIAYANGAVTTNIVHNAYTNMVAKWNRFGSQGTGGYFTGWLPELIYFTNALSSSDVAILHRYATNTYGFSP